VPPKPPHFGEGVLEVTSKCLVRWHACSVEELCGKSILSVGIWLKVNLALPGRPQNKKAEGLTEQGVGNGVSRTMVIQIVIVVEKVRSTSGSNLAPTVRKWT
jgi:hypothetical protein